MLSDDSSFVQGGDADVGHRLSSCMIGPAASSSSLLNEWLLIRTLQLAGELPDPLPSPAPVQYAMALPSLQLLSFIVCRSTVDRFAAPPSSSSQYDYDPHDIVLLVRDCRAKRVWRMRQCYGPKRTETAAAAAEQESIAPVPSTDTPPHPTTLPFSDAPDDRFYSAWQSSLQSLAKADTPTTAAAAGSPTTDSTTTHHSVSHDASFSSSSASSASSSTIVPPSAATSAFSSNLRSAIAAAKAKSPPFASTIGSSSRHSNWKAAPQPFSLFDAAGEAEAWLNAQQQTAEHEQYTRSLQEQVEACNQQPAQLQLSPLVRPTEQQAADVGDGWSELHALLHHLGFFSSLLPTHAATSASALFPYALSPSTFSLSPPPNGAHSLSLLLLHPSATLTDTIDELDSISDSQLHRVMILIRRAQQTTDWEMIANHDEDSVERQQADVGDKADAGAFSSLLASFSALSGQSRQSEQVVWFVPSRLCCDSSSGDADSSLGDSADTLLPAVWTNLLSACTVRVIWCEGDADYISPHRQRQRERRQKRREHEARERDASTDQAVSSPEVSPSDAVTAFPATSKPSHSIALVYIVVSPQPADGTYRVRIDCDWRLRNKQRRAEQMRPGRSQSHSNAIVSAPGAGSGMHGSRWLPPPLIKSNSLTNTHQQPPLSASAASSRSASSATGTVFQSLFKRLGSRSGRTISQPADHLAVREGRRGGGGTHNPNSPASATRTSSLSPTRPPPASSSLFATQRSPRRDRGVRNEGDGSVASHSYQHHHHHQHQQQAERRRSERAAAMKRHPVLSQPFPPSEWHVGTDELPARLSDAALLCARRVQAWRDCRQQTSASHIRYNRGHESAENAAPRRGPRSAANAAMDERSRLLRDMVREHGELTTPAAFLESVFGQHAPETVPQQH